MRKYLCTALLAGTTLCANIVPTQEEGIISRGEAQMEILMGRHELEVPNERPLSLEEPEDFIAPPYLDVPSAVVPPRPFRI